MHAAGIVPACCIGRSKADTMQVDDPLQDATAADFMFSLCYYNEPVSQTSRSFDAQS